MTTLYRARGDTYPDVFSVADTNGVAVDITGYTFLMTLDISKTPKDATNNLYQLTGIISDALNGLVAFTPTALQTDQVPGTYYYDVQMTDDLGRVRTIETGKYIYRQDITK